MRSEKDGMDRKRSGSTWSDAACNDGHVATSYERNNTWCDDAMEGIEDGRADHGTRNGNVMWVRRAGCKRKQARPGVTKTAVRTRGGNPHARFRTLWFRSCRRKTWVVGRFCGDVASHRALRRDMDKRRGLRERMTKGSAAANGGSTATGSSEEDVDGQRRRSTKCAVDFSRLDVATLRKYRRVNRLEDISNGTKEQLLPGIIQHFGSQVRRNVDACSLRSRETC